MKCPSARGAEKHTCMEHMLHEALASMGADSSRRAAACRKSKWNAYNLDYAWGGTNGMKTSHRCTAMHMYITQCLFPISVPPKARTLVLDIYRTCLTISLPVHTRAMHMCRAVWEAQSYATTTTQLAWPPLRHTPCKCQGETFLLQFRYLQLASPHGRFRTVWTPAIAHVFCPFVFSIDK